MTSPNVQAALLELFFMDKHEENYIYIICTRVIVVKTSKTFYILEINYKKIT